VACHAPFGLDRGVLIHVGPTHLRVALGADHVLIGRGLQVVVPEGAVNVMTVVALHQASFTLWWKGMENAGFTSE